MLTAAGVSFVSVFKWSFVAVRRDATVALRVWVCSVLTKTYRCSSVFTVTTATEVRPDGVGVVAGLVPRKYVDSALPPALGVIAGIVPSGCSSDQSEGSGWVGRGGKRHAVSLLHLPKAFGYRLDALPFGITGFRHGASK